MEGSERWFNEAVRLMPGGVNSPVRSFRAVGGKPFFVRSARGSRLTDVDGRELIDYVGTWGPAILGHAPPEVVRAITECAAEGTSFGTPHPREVEMARLLCGSLPSMEKVRLCNSGTEATMSAIRLARGFTGRKKVVKFSGCYHGHVDSLLVRSGSGALTLGIPDSLGVPEEFTRDTIVIPFNDFDSVRAAYAASGKEIAAVILEPVPANAGLYLPREGFLEFLREITAREGSLLVFDEVMTGFRLEWGGVQNRHGIRPDLTCLGKIIGGGLPVGAFGGRAEVMDRLAPLGGVYQAGTLSGNPLALAAGLAALERLRDGEVHRRLEERGRQLEDGLRQAIAEAGATVQVHRDGSMFCLFFCGSEVTRFEEAQATDAGRFGRFFQGMLQKGIYLAPSPFETQFLSAAHSEEDIRRTVEAAAWTLKELG